MGNFTKPLEVLTPVTSRPVWVEGRGGYEPTLSPGAGPQPNANVLRLYCVMLRFGLWPNEQVDKFSEWLLGTAPVASGPPAGDQSNDLLQESRVESPNDRNEHHQEFSPDPDDQFADYRFTGQLFQ